MRRNVKIASSGKLRFRFESGAFFSLSDIPCRKVSHVVVMVYRWELGTRRLLVGLNFSAQPPLTSVQVRGKILFSTSLDRWNERLDSELKLRGNEGIVAELE